MIATIIGVIILAIVVYVSIRVLKNAIVGVALIALVVVGSFFIFGSFPDMSGIPVIGGFLEGIPTTTGDAVAIIKNVFHRFDILEVSRDAENRIMVTVANTGRMDLSGFEVLIDGETANVINSPIDPLGSGKVTTIQTDWKGIYENVTVLCNQTSSEYIRP